MKNEQIEQIKAEILQAFSRELDEFLEDSEKFLKKLEHYADDYKKKVCIADGAKWIWLWATATYPEMTQILDFFHVLEKIR